jgi:hypothetical protein
MTRTSPCAPRALLAWRDAVAATLGGDPKLLCPNSPIFGSFTPAGQLKLRDGKPVRMRADSINDLIKSLAVAAGLHDPATQERNRYGGHSLRAGFITQAARDGENPLEIQKVSKHRSLDQLLVYIREEDLRQNNPAQRLFSRRARGNGRAGHTSR